MRVSVIGTGAIGSYYGMMLANAGHEVDFLLRSDYAYVKENGLHMRSAVHGDVVLPKVNAFKHTADMPVADTILVCLKTTQNKKVLQDLLPPLLKKDTVVILIQNGLGMEEDLAAQFPGLSIAGGVAQIAAQKEASGLVVHQDYGNLDLGSYTVQEAAALEEFSGLLNAAGVRSTTQNLGYLRWKKLIWNVALNGLSVVLDKTTAEILADAQDLKRCRAIMSEVVKGAVSCGVPLPDSLVGEMIAFTEKMRPYLPSMKLDYDNGRPLELEYMYQRPILAAARAGFDMATAKALYQELQELTSLPHIPGDNG
ncbi:2-dehydropantoate 2-reductase [Pedobacter sp. AW31-3R]|uniref:2-dehydropantoate 2-reductase n=1 Tax=Pedobacter sp. AW31-3R TaxID=3445781 RepID=UPI003FA11B4D